VLRVLVSVTVFGTRCRAQNVGVGVGLGFDIYTPGSQGFGVRG
jgi:hypothetical protein